MQTKDPVRVLGISGSLRQASSNSAVVAAAALLCPEGVELSTSDALSQLPPFNPDIDEDDVPASVRRFQSELQHCDAILLSSPEYAHGVPGVLKNALDWVVGSGELIDKPIALINASARATHAWRSLVETLTTMSARVVRDASVTIALDGRRLDAGGIVKDAALSAALQAALETLVSDAREPQAAASLDDGALRTIPPGEDRNAYLPLLKLAEESDQQLRSYLQKGPLYAYAMRESARAVGAILTAPAENGTVELKAVAVVEPMQGLGIGGRMLRALIEELRGAGVKRLVVGTASSGVRELGFYQRAGFRLSRIERDFFSSDKGYPANLQEQGIPVRDMVWMDQDLV